MNKSRWLVIILLLLLLMASLLPSAAVVAATEQCFPETDFCISARFRTFWEQQGGLAVFGFPVTAPHTEVNRENGQPYLTQWFERGRFELHPENTQPYDVLLGRIGEDRMQGNGVSWQALPKASGQQPDCLWFPETGHNICDQESGLGFKQYWQTHGLLDPLLDSHGRSLALFGLPLSEATTEINPTDGKPYITQWFERGRFEWHPEQTDPQYRVLLGLLGKEVLLAPQKIGDDAFGSLVAHGPIVAWRENEDDEHTAIVAYNIDTRTRTSMASSVNLQSGLATDGDMLVWEETTFWKEGSPRILPCIRAYDLDHNQLRTLLTAQDSNEEYGQLAIADGVLYLEHHTTSQQGLYALNLSTGEQQQIAPSGHNPVVAEGFLLWTETSTQGSGPGMNFTHRLMLRTLDGSQADRQIAQNNLQSGFSRYALANGKVVWAGYVSSIFVYDIHDDTTTTFGSNTFFPTILGQYILWASSGESSQWSISGQAFSAEHVSFTMQESGMTMDFVGVGSNAIVYMRGMNEDMPDVYMQQIP
ncbi:MAG: hypothetical protein HGA19_17085 [Oscillochloris sp.]|nr:hypothetical protein [Oscillochloris sp.]